MMVFDETDQAVLRQKIGTFFSVLALLGQCAAWAQPPAASVTAGHKTVLLSIDDALRIGSGESEAVWVAEAGVMRAVGTEMTTRSSLFPQLSGSGAYIRTLRSQFGNIKIPAGPGGTTEAPPLRPQNQYS